MNGRILWSRTDRPLAERLAGYLLVHRRASTSTLHQFVMPWDDPKEREETLSEFLRLGIVKEEVMAGGLPGLSLTLYGEWVWTERLSRDGSFPLSETSPSTEERILDGEGDRERAEPLTIFSEEGHSEVRNSDEVDSEDAPSLVILW